VHKDRMVAEFVAAMGRQPSAQEIWICAVEPRCSLVRRKSIDLWLA
jgi:hypothetical protein